MDNKKKEQIKTVAIIVLLLVIVFGGSYFASEVKSNKNTSSKTTTPTTNNQKNTTTNGDNDTEISEDKQAELNSIDIDKYLSLKKGSDKSIIYISRPTCHYCQQEDPIIKNIVYETEFKEPVGFLRSGNDGTFVAARRHH